MKKLSWWSLIVWVTRVVLGRGNLCRVRKQLGCAGWVGASRVCGVRGVTGGPGPAPACLDGPALRQG